MSADTSSNDAATPRLKRTPLYDEHRALGARLVEFSGWEMPVQYSGILEEHRAVRERAGIFDVSHMGEFRIEGPGALDFLQGLVPNNVARLTDGQALYTQICNEQGGTLDDLTIYRFSETHYMAVVNAGTAESDWTWFTEQAAGRADVTLTNISDETGLLALQGPRASDILSSLTDTDLDTVAYYHFAEGTVAGVSCLILRTGYTGEDGFELCCASGDVVALWRALLTTGASAGLLPAGLGARDTLRLEAGFCLYGMSSPSRSRRWRLASAGRSSWRKATTSSDAQRCWRRRSRGCRASVWASSCATGAFRALATPFCATARPSAS